MSRARDIIRDIQEQSGKSLQDFENEMGIRRETLSRVANGNPKYPGDKLIPELEAYADRLGISLSQFPVSKRVDALPLQPSKDEQVLDSFLDQSPHQPIPSTVIESTPESDDDISPEIRDIAKRANTHKRHTVQQRPVPQAPIPARQIPPKLVQQPLQPARCAECGTQNVPLSRKVPDANMGAAFIYVCTKCLKRPANPQLRQQVQPTTSVPDVTRTEIPWGQFFGQIFKKRDHE